MFVSLGKRIPMKHTTLTLILILCSFALAGIGCTGSSSPQIPPAMAEEISENNDPPIIGTWQLLTVLTFEGEDSLLADYTDGIKGIKMLMILTLRFFSTT